MQAAPETPRRTSCTNNMKNLGIACLNFHDSTKHLPVSNRPAGVTNANREHGREECDGVMCSRVASPRFRRHH